MKAKTFVLMSLFLFGLLVGQVLAENTRMPSSRGLPGPERRPAALHRFRAGRHVIVPNYYYPYYYPYLQGFGHYEHWKHELYFGPHHHLLPSHPLVYASPYVCLFHERSFINQAGFVDHVGGTHKIPLRDVVSFCNPGGSSCVFPGY
jgi:hypothetical protein